MRIENPRLRLLCGRHGRTIVVALLAVAALSFGAAGMQYQDPPTDTVTQQTRQQSVETSTSTRIVVTGNDSLWPAGTVLEDQPVYLANASEEMTVTAETTVAGADDARITHEWVLVVRATRAGEQFYAERERLARRTVEATTARTNATVNVTDARARINRISDAVGVAGVVDATLVLRVNYVTEPEESYGYDGSQSFSTALVLESGAYTLSERPGGQESHSEPVTTQVTRPRNWTQLSALLLVGVVALLGAVGVVVVDPRSIDVEAARHQLHRERYEEWISPGVIPMGIEQQFIELESLEDVVDVAIDTRERVVYDRRRDLYAVISENVVYYFSTGGSWDETIFPWSGMGPDGNGGGGEGPDGAFGMGGDFGMGDEEAFAGGAAGAEAAGGADGAFGMGGEEEPFGMGAGPDGDPFDGDDAGGGPFGDDEGGPEAGTGPPEGPPDGDDGAGTTPPEEPGGGEFPPDVFEGDDESVEFDPDVFEDEESEGED